MPQFFSLSQDRKSLALEGIWRISNLSEISSALDALPEARTVSELDGTKLEELDTAGAMLLFQHLAGTGKSAPKLRGFSEETSNIVKLVSEAWKPSQPLRDDDQGGIVHRIGVASVGTGMVLRKLTQFIGETTVELARSALHPRLIRMKELFIQLEISGIDAIPIVCLVTFLIGVVVAYLFGLQIAKYGANIFIVDAVGLAMCRELSPILVAIIVAGRSGSAYTAQIGTMKINEEIDAMLTLGLSPTRVLVFPRVLALMIAMPLLTFVGDVLGILGSMIVADLSLDITGATFLQRLHVVLPVRSLFVGLVKAPVFAAFIGIIGCQMGLAVEDNARSVGLNTTATVVRSIVAVILLNAAFAIVFQKLRI